MKQYKVVTHRFPFEFQEALNIASKHNWKVIASNYTGHTYYALLEEDDTKKQKD